MNGLNEPGSWGLRGTDQRTRCCTRRAAHKYGQAPLLPPHARPPLCWPAGRELSVVRNSNHRRRKGPQGAAWRDDIIAVGKCGCSQQQWTANELEGRQC